MAEVIFVKKDSARKIPLALKKVGLKKFAGKEVLVKLHMGEENNKWYVKPNIVKIVFDEMKKIKSEPFLFDTVVLYRGSRDSKEKYMAVARQHGFTAIGCEVVIGDEGTRVKMEDCGIKFSYEVVKELYRTKDVVAISHAKGHVLTGFCGAIKNFGMGGVSKRSKLEMHAASTLKKFLSLGTAKTAFDRILALGAKACLAGKNVLYMNVLLDITRECDCVNDALPIICKDLGFLFSSDPVAVDAASVEMIQKNAGNVFERDPWEHIRFAEKIGLGSMKYELVEI